MSSERRTINVGPGIPGLLGVLFIGLKPTGYVSWSWLWVLSPFWLPHALVLGICAVVLVVALIVAACK
jgi:hypothetical protein